MVIDWRSGLLIVERTDLLTNITAGDPIPHGLMQLSVDQAAMLDRQVTDAALRIKLVWTDALGGASVNTSRTSAAMIIRRHGGPGEAGGNWGPRGKHNQGCSFYLLIVFSAANAFWFLRASVSPCLRG